MIVAAKRIQDNDIITTSHKCPALSHQRWISLSESFILFNCLFVHLFSRIFSTTSFSGESCNAQFSASRSQTTVNMTLLFKANTELQLHDYVYF